MLSFDWCDFVFYITAAVDGGPSDTLAHLSCFDRGQGAVGRCEGGTLFSFRIWAQGGSKAPDLQHAMSPNRRKWPVPWPPCVSTMTRWRSKTWTCPTTRCSVRGGRGPNLEEPTHEEGETEEWCVTVTKKSHSLKSKGKLPFDRNSVKLWKTEWAIFSHLRVTSCLLVTFYASLYLCTQQSNKCHLSWLFCSLIWEIKLFFMFYNCVVWLFSYYSGGTGALYYYRGRGTCTWVFPPSATLYIHPITHLLQ